MKSGLLASLAAVALLAASSSVLSGPGAAVQGDKVDSGLGSLPHYSLWKDPTGRDPMGLNRVHVASQ